MNIDELITQLRERSLINDVPQNHLIQRRELEYSGVERLPLGRGPATQAALLSPDLDGDEIAQGRLGEWLWIADGDAPLPTIDTTAIGAGIDRDGADALAWYRSFHWLPPKDWGIYILDKSLYYLADRIFRHNRRKAPYGRNFNLLDWLQQAYRLLFLHEYFHFVTDVAASALEMGHSSPPALYANYVTNVYMRPRQSDEPLEEALANAFAFRRMTAECSTRILRDFMSTQPPGYRAFASYEDRESFANGRRRLAGSVVDSKNALRMPPLEILFDIQQRDLRYSDVPVYLLRTLKEPAYGLQFVRRIGKSEIEESAAVKKALSKLPLQVKARYKSALERLAQDARHPSLNFEKLRGCDTVFSIRVDLNYRVSLRPTNGKWELLRIAEHDDLYRNPGA